MCMIIVMLAFIWMMFHVILILLLLSLFVMMSDIDFVDQVGGGECSEFRYLGPSVLTLLGDNFRDFHSNFSFILGGHG